MKQITIIKYKILLLLVLVIFLLIFSAYSFKEGIKNKIFKKKIKNNQSSQYVTSQPVTSDTAISNNSTNQYVTSQYVTSQPVTSDNQISNNSTSQYVTSDTSISKPVTNDTSISNNAISNNVEIKPETSIQLTDNNIIEDGNYIIMSNEFKSAVSAYPKPLECNAINRNYNILSINNQFSVTDIWTVKTVNNKTTIQQNNCNYLELNIINNRLFNAGIIDPTTQTLQTNDNSANIFYWKINKNLEDNTYSLVPFDNQDTKLYTFTFTSMNLELNTFINNNNNNINNKIAKFIFNKIS